MCLGRAGAAAPGRRRGRGRGRGRGKGRARCAADLLERLREVRLLGEALGVTEVVIDGSVIVLGDDGRPSGGAVGGAARGPFRGRSPAAERPLPGHLMISDLLWLDGHSTMALAYSERRRLLDGLALVRGRRGRCRRPTRGATARRCWRPRPATGSGRRRRQAARQRVWDGRFGLFVPPEVRRTA